jgi:hypothetical protein
MFKTTNGLREFRQDRGALSGTGRLRVAVAISLVASAYTTITGSVFRGHFVRRRLECGDYDPQRRLRSQRSLRRADT